jgi:type 1 glutamine amidotransferase
MPEKVYARPLKPRKLLVFNLCKGFKHSSIPCAAKMLEIMGRKTGAFEPVLSEDPAAFAADNLAQFDAVCFNNTTGELFDDPALRQSLLDFVKGGKGVVGIHAATDCFYQWPEYGEMMGGYFDGHPWNETVTVKIDEPEHPLNQAFGGQAFEVADEIYQFRDPYSRQRLRVLLSLDTGRTNMQKEGIKRSDGDFAVSWVRTYGGGRVFFCSLGHREEVFWNPKILGHYLAGIQFALGDLPADAMPIGNPAAGGKAEGPTTAEDWRPLFNGTDLTGWTYKEEAWAVEDGVLTRKGGSDLWTQEQFGDFVLELEFKLDPQTNSGIFLRTADQKDCVQTGIEVQILDSFGKDPPDKHDCGAVYDCVAPAKNVVKKPGEWNHIVLTCQGPKIQIIMNGERIIDMDLDQWTEVAKNPDGTPNKFKTAYKDMPRAGYIGFQDHGKAVWFRNIRIQPLLK